MSWMHELIPKDKEVEPPSNDNDEEARPAAIADSNVDIPQGGKVLIKRKLRRRETYFDEERERYHQ